MRVFVDTGYCYARIDRSDQRHEAARRAVRPGMVFVTSNLAAAPADRLSLKMDSRARYGANLYFPVQLPPAVESQTTVTEGSVASSSVLPLGTVQTALLVWTSKRTSVPCHDANCVRRRPWSSKNLTRAFS